MQKSQADNEDKRLENIGVLHHDIILHSCMHFLYGINRSAMSIYNAHAYLHACLNGLSCHVMKLDLSGIA